jgi:transposase InsO family protein
VDRSSECSDRLAEEGAVTSVGSKGDSYDNALAEAVNALYKAELIRRRGPWRSVDDVELATLKWVHWWTTSACTAPATTCRPPSTKRCSTVNPLRSPAA